MTPSKKTSRSYPVHVHQIGKHRSAFLNLICYVSVLNAAVFCLIEVGSTIALELDRRLQNDIQFNFDSYLQKWVLPSAGKLLNLGCTEGRKLGLM